MKNRKGFFKKLKREIDTDMHKVTDKISETGETIESGLTDVGEKIEQTSKGIKVLSKFHLLNVKKEGEDIRKALAKKDLIYLKTDALAVVLRKLGGLDDFLAVFDKLTKEGYLLVWTEPVSSFLPIGMGLVGNFYYFQKGKLIA
ncbi:MAG TPA: hypothetical protein VD731_08555 [Nitrosopumilaceae archaeon]|nr:hypothetical protein [Nitrosopumilaceae archaeon]